MCDGARMTTNELWQQCLLDLKHETDETEYQQWLLPLVAWVESDTLVLDAINDFFVKHIEKNYRALLVRLVSEHSQGAVTKVRLQVMQSPASSTPKPAKKSKMFTYIEESGPINEAYTFDAFVKGKSNALAYNACYEMAKKGSASTYSSLFIHGVSGVGKTHLMQAVAHRYQKNGKKFCYFTSDSFMKKVAEAFRANNVTTFQNNIMQADLLIIDDVHLVPSSQKPKMAQVLLSLYSDFIEGGKRVILASDKPPTQMEGFDSRFLSRFSEGLTAGIDPPEMDTRVQILEKKAANLSLELPKECVIFIAQHVSPDVRRLEGALNQIHATADMLGCAVDIELVRQALKSHIVARASSINADAIKGVVAEYYSISVKDLVGKKRVRQIARPRQIAMALTRELTGDSFPDIGQAFGGRDHSTVMHACEKVEELRQTDPKFEKDYKALSLMLELF